MTNRWLVFLILLSSLLVLCGFPSPIPGQRVYDFANVTTVQTEVELESLLTQVESETTAQVAVVTVYSLDEKTIDEYANELFNNWGIGQSNVNNGVLFLIAPNERRTRIEVGYGLEPLITDSLAGEILDDFVIPEFKSGDTDRGILNGTREIARILRAYPDAARGVPGSTPWYVASPASNTRMASYAVLGLAALLIGVTIWSSRRNSFSTLLFFVLVVCLIAAAAVSYYWFFSTSKEARPLKEPIGGLIALVISLIASVKKYFRYGPHSCPKCGTKMDLMSELTDDAKLTEVQKLEEKLGSVDYDVWFCHSCLATDTEKYVANFSGYKKCPGCGNQTCKETSQVVVHATYTATGLRRVTETCASCKHNATRTEMIPRKTHSSSSGSGSSGGGGSFGGGSSGGGGASRGW